MATDIGMVRSNNQDAAYTFFSAGRSVLETPDFGLFIVADGMGGHLDGEKASAVTVKVVSSQLIRRVFMPLLNNDYNGESFMETLEEAIKSANSEVVAQVPDGGTTITMVMLIGSMAYVAHVGDSRAYLITNNSIEALTRDHSLVQRLLELGQITPEEALNHQHKNVLYRALGQNETIDVDIFPRRLPPSSRILLCSDGLWGQVNDQEIFDAVRTAPTLHQACQRLVALANSRGGIDNVSVIVLQTAS
jgi:protein phosphatase